MATLRGGLKCRMCKELILFKYGANVLAVHVQAVFYCSTSLKLQPLLHSRLSNHYHVSAH